MPKIFELLLMNKKFRKTPINLLEYNTKIDEEVKVICYRIMKVFSMNIDYLISNS